MSQPRLSPVPRKFLNQKDAAAYCGYGVPAFKEYVDKYNIPRCGPDGRKFNVSDLDAFMTNRLIFSPPPSPPRSRPQSLVVV